LRKMRLAVVGATGEVGRMMIRVLEENKLKPSLIRFFSSIRSAGTELRFMGKSYYTEELVESSFNEPYDYALFSAGTEASRLFSPIAAVRGTTIIDNSSAFRLEKGIPLVVPEINGDLLKNYHGIVANPNCSTIQMVLSLKEVHKLYGLKMIVVSTYQAVSGAGRKGIKELDLQEKGLTHEASVFTRQIYRNVVPQIGDILENGFSTEEMKMVLETRKIFNDQDISIWPTTIRVPVEYGHSESLYVETRKPFVLEDLKKRISCSENVVLKDDIITPLEVAGSDLTFVSRLRSFDDKRFLMWNIADNIRVGAATNAVRIMLKHAFLNRLSR